MSKHTPGPWTLVFDEAIAVRDADGGRVAICTNLRGPHGMGGRRDTNEVEANARLMAAAPMLLEALLAYQYANRIHNDAEGDLYEKGKAAIASAAKEQA